MVIDPIKNFAKVEISTGYASGATSIVLETDEGAKLPDPVADGEFNLVWYNSSDYPDPSDDPDVEIVRCTGKSTDTLTVTRGQESTGDVNHNTAAKTYKFILAFTKKSYDDIDDKLHTQDTDTVLQSSGDTVDQQQTIFSTANTLNVGNGYDSAQTFTAGETGDLTNIKFWIKRNHSATERDLIVEIRTTVADKPTAVVLSTDTIPSSNFPIGEYDGIWVNYVLTLATPLAITSGTKYAIVYRVSQDDGFYYLGDDGAIGIYADGDYYRTLDGEENWDVYSDWGSYFVTYVDIGVVDLINDRVLKNNLLVDDLIKVDGRDISVDGTKLDGIEDSAVALATVKSDTDIADAITKKHTQGTDQKLDDGGANEVTVAEVKDAVDKKHTQGTDTQLDSGVVEVDGSNNVLINQNSIVAFTSLESGAIVNTLYLKEGKVGIGTNDPSESLDLIGNLELETTTTDAKGVIYKNGEAWIHDFHHPTGASAIPVGQNVFIGEAGNFTVGSTAASVSQGSRNVAIGKDSMNNLQQGYNNVAIGCDSTIDARGMHDQVAVGYRAMYYSNSLSNVGIGSYAMFNLNSGSYNVGIGQNVLYFLKGGAWNIGIGWDAGRYLANGSSQNNVPLYSIYLGVNSKASIANQTNEIVIGYNAIGLGSNSVVLGSTSVVLTRLHGVLEVLDTNLALEVSDEFIGGNCFTNTNPANLLVNGDFELWEAGAAVAPDEWIFGGDGSIAREGTIVKLGTYSTELVGTSTGCYMYQYIETEKGITYWQGRTITLSCWVYATVADRARLNIWSKAGGENTYSSYHTGDSTWQLLTVTHSIGATATGVQIVFYVDTGATTAYFDGAMLVEGSVPFAFSPRALSRGGTIVVEVDETKFSHKIPVSIAGTLYYIMLTQT